MSNISLIAAAAENDTLGKDNRLIWHLPADLRYFKQTTMGKPIIMGRKTYQSVGRPLPGRTNVIISRNIDFLAPGCIVVSSLEDAIEIVKSEEKEIMIVGGADIYRQSMEIADKIYLTRIHAIYEGDTFFPSIPEDKWELRSQEDFEPDEKNPVAFSFLVYERKN